ncbi:ABC transporter substrate-binding protein [Lacrimispora sp.]|uniref:ABC transporter substrate-binding protein n=1 Tax=Lacrimispora sp. TaxID=2719234 RepID=UPI0034616831
MRKAITAVLTLTLAASVLTGCGGSTNSSGGTTSGGSTTAAASEEPIKIGVIAPVTGDRAEAGKSVWLSFEIAIQDINAKGGVLGRQVELVREDSKADSKEAVELAKKMVDNKDVVAVLGPMTSAEAIACSPIFDEGGLVELAPVASNNEYAVMSPWSFTVAGRQSAEMPYFVEKILSEYSDTKSIGVIYVNDDWGVSSIESLTPACEKAGIEITTAENFAAGEKDFTAILTKIRQTNPESLVIMTQAAEGSLILNQVAAMGWDVNTIGVGAMYSDQVIQLAGEKANGLVAPSCFFLSEDDAPAWEYAAKFEKEAGFKPTIHGPLSYDAALVLCDAIERADSTGREAIREALQATKGFKGLAGDYEFTEDGDMIRQYRVLQVEDGLWSAKTDYASATNVQ